MKKIASFIVRHKKSILVCCCLFIIGVSVYSDFILNAGKDKATESSYLYTSEANPDITSDSAKILGEAKLVDNIGKAESDDSYFVSAELNRERSREEALETLQVVIDSAGVINVRSGADHRDRYGGNRIYRGKHQNRREKLKSSCAHVSCKRYRKFGRPMAAPTVCMAAECHSNHCRSGHRPPVFDEKAARSNERAAFLGLFRFNRFQTDPPNRSRNRRRCFRWN